MDLDQYFEYESEAIPVDKIYMIKERYLWDLSSKCNEIYGMNVFFHFLNTYYYYKNNNYIEEQSYVCYLMTVYLFSLLTPPHSEKLAMEYILEAISLTKDKEHLLKYNEELEHIKHKTR